MSTDALTEQNRQDIRAAYAKLQQEAGLEYRRSQASMIGETAQAFAAGQPLVLDAETGVGKSLGYLLPGLLLAQQHDKTLVISTATTLLQRQLCEHDLPQLCDALGLQMNWAIAKGRQRYLCKLRLDTNQPQLGLDGVGGSAGPKKSLVGEIESALEQGWDGDLDSAPMELPADAYSQLTVGPRQCRGPQCTHFHDCCFFAARNALNDVRVIATNHDFLLSHWLLHRSSALPKPEDCYLVVDEAHRFGERVRTHLGASQSLATLRQQAATLGDQSEHFGKLLEKRAPKLLTLTDKLGQSCQSVRERLAGVEGWMQKNARHERVFASADEVDAVLREACEELLQAVQGAGRGLDGLLRVLQDGVLDADMSEGNLAQWQLLFGVSADVFAESEKLLVAFVDTVARARWSRLDGNGNWALSAEPLLLEDEMLQPFWEELGGLLLTSATLRSMGSFDYLLGDLCLPEDTRAEALEGVLNHSEQARLVVPRMNHIPAGGEIEPYTQELLQRMPAWLAGEGGRLVLFTSRKHLQQVSEALRKSMDDAESLLVQGSDSLGRLLQRHSERLQEGKMSCLLGLNSLAEGLDLPGNECTRVIIVRLPFADFTSPVERCWQRHYEMENQNAFAMRALPQASLRLYQACGRLLRSPEDSGDIVVFDNRLTQKGYGRQLIRALPAFTLVTDVMAPVDMP